MSVRHAPAAPEDFNPFAWLIAEPAGPPPSLRDPEEVLGISESRRSGTAARRNVGDVRGADAGRRCHHIGAPARGLRRTQWSPRTHAVDHHRGHVDQPARRVGQELRVHLHPLRETSPQAAGAEPSAREAAKPRESAAESPSLAPDLADLGVPPVGAEVPTFQRVTGPANWNRYAAVNDEFVAIHMDDEAGRAAGASGAFGMGNLQWAYLHNMLRDWAGDRGRITAASCQFRALNTKGQKVSARGRVTAVRAEAGQILVDLDIWTEDQDLRTLAKGSATVALHGGF